MKKKSKTVQDIEDVTFIMEEIIRFRSMSFEELKVHHETNRQDALCSIPHPEPERGILVCGREAYNRFYQIAERHLATEPSLKNNFDAEVFANAVVEEFVRVFLKDAREVDQRWVNKMLSATVKKLKSKHKALTHYIPCVIVSDKEPQEFRIGPVRFMTVDKFLSENHEALENERRRLLEDGLKNRQEMIEKGLRTAEELLPENSAKFADMLVDGLTEYFKQFRWVAEVAIPECEEEVSLRRAEIVVEAALDILKLFFTESYGKNLRLGHSRGFAERTASLTREADEKLNIKIHRGSEHVPGGSAWFEKVTGKDPFYIKAAGTALQSLIDPRYVSHLGQRFLDALNWYGQAVTELRPSAQIIKYAAALERLTVTKKEKDLTQVVTRRTALLTYDKDKGDFERAKKDAGEIYEWRSNLMHGSCSPFDRELDSVTPLAEKITRRALFVALDLFVYLDNTIENAKEIDLEKKYQSLESELTKDQSSMNSDATTVENK
jgi:hypothetical protein